MNGFKHQHESISGVDNELSKTAVNGQRTAKSNSVLESVELSNDLV